MWNQSRSHRVEGWSLEAIVRGEEDCYDVEHPESGFGKQGIDEENCDEEERADLSGEYKDSTIE
jgi:hypothetical protein